MIQGGKRRAVCHGDCHCGTDGLFQQRASPAGKPSEERRTSTPAVGHSGRARRCLAGSGSKDWRHGSADAAGLGDPVQRTGTRRSDQQVRTGCARQAHQKAQSVSRRSGGGRTDPGDPRCGALARLRPDHVSARGIRPLGVGRHGLTNLEGAGLFACERQAQGLQAGCRCRGNVQKNFPSRVAQIRAKLAPGTPIEVWCQDEMRVGQKNKLTYRWARKGSRPRATHDQRTESTYLFGAVCPERGTGAALVLPACNSEAMQLHLDEIATKVTSGAHAIVLLDQAGWHGTKMLKVPSNMSLMPLPRPSPSPITGCRPTASPSSIISPPTSVRACETSKHYRSRLARPLLVSSNALLAEKQNKYQSQQKRKAHKRGNLVCRYAAHWRSYLPQRMVFEQQQLNCSFLLAVRSELLEEAPQIFGLLLVLNPRKHHFGAWNLRPGIFDVFLEGRFVPDDPGTFVRIRVIVAWHRA